MPHQNYFLKNLARAFLAGPWSSAGLLQRAGEACGAQVPWLRSLVRRILTSFPEGTHRPDEEALTTFLVRNTRLQASLHKRGLHGLIEQPRRIFWVTPQMKSTEGIPANDLPQLHTSPDIAQWLGVTLDQLDWLAVPPWRARSSSEKTSHYAYQWLQKRSGKPRLIEAPKPRLKAIQRHILHNLLDKVPPHEAAHGFRRGRSILTFVAPHAATPIILKFDLRDFFPSIPASRANALFRRLGYPRDVAQTLTRLCTNALPSVVVEVASKNGLDYETRGRFAHPHLPQGSPTSPTLANLCAYRLDRRLAGLARALGASYTRYADDLAFSGGSLLERNTRRLHVLVCRIALEEGFEVQTRKTRFMRQGVRQQLAGVVLNQHPNVRRAVYDRLKAILYNCLRHQPTSQNREGVPDFRAHLLGCIGHVAHVHPGRGEKLRALFDQIQW